VVGGGGGGRGGGGGGGGGLCARDGLFVDSHWEAPHPPNIKNIVNITSSSQHRFHCEINLCGSVSSNKWLD